MKKREVQKLKLNKVKVAHIESFNINKIIGGTLQTFSECLIPTSNTSKETFEECKTTVPKKDTISGVNLCGTYNGI